MIIRDLLAVSRGEKPADLVLRNGRVVNVFSGEIERTGIAVYAGHIAGLGEDYRGETEIDLGGAYVTPGLIDGHVHIESSLCVPAHFAAGVLPHGVTTVVADPHEIANVAGVAGIRFMARSSRHLPLHVVWMAPSCVPATTMENTGASLSADDLALLLQEGTVHGQAEMMNYPGAICGDASVLAKLAAFGGRPIDGHAPLISGMALNAYAAAGIGSEHECTTVEEAAEKLARGLYILIREATNARNLHALLPLVTPANSRRIAFCTDDRVPADLIDQGSIDYMVAEAVRFGIDPITALRMATLNTAEWFGLHERGAIAPGRVADLVVVDSLEEFRVRQVYAAGVLVAENGRLVAGVEAAPSAVPEGVGGSVRVDWQHLNMRIAVPAGNTSANLRVIGMIEGQIVTEERILPARVESGQAIADPERDLLKIAVVERHKALPSMGLGFIQGMGLRHGAIAGTIAHDHHNLVIVGADDGSMRAAAHAVAEMGGGLAVTDGEEVIASLPLPVGGLMSDQPVAQVRAGYDALLAAAAALGSPLHDPFMAMSFMALEVVPDLKLTDKGLVDVRKFEFVDLFV